jgi:GDPmannose 4,6-dehydratase
MAKMYREGYKQFIACGILFNHESPRRGPHFVTRKVARAAACIKLGIKKNLPLNEKGEPLINRKGKLTLGFLEGKRDWGFAKDYVEAMWLMLQQKKPDDFVIATGIIHTVKDLCKVAFGRVGLDWRNYVEVDHDFIRPLETGPLVGVPKKARKVLKWSPRISFEELIGIMVDHELAELR